jgi:hypothetical protein
MQKFSILLFLAASTPIYAQSAPENIDPSLAIVSTQIDHRVLVFSRCSPEHCWSETYLQGLAADPDPPEVLCTTQIGQISTGYAVESVDWRLVNHAPEITLKISASHGGFEPHKVRIIPLDGCQYAFVDSQVGS